MSIDDKLRAAGIELPAAAPPAANYVPFVMEGGMLHIAGQIPFRDGVLVKGRLGEDMGVEEGRATARLCGIGLLAQMKAALGSLDRVKRVVKLGVFVSSTPGFTDQPEVGNGASLGHFGRHSGFHPSEGRRFHMLVEFENESIEQLSLRSVSLSPQFELGEEFLSG